MTDVLTRHDAALELVRTQALASEVYWCQPKHCPSWFWPKSPRELAYIAESNREFEAIMKRQGPCRGDGSAGRSL